MEVRADDRSLDDKAISPGLIAIFALACGLAVANLYYAQPLLGSLSVAFGVSQASAGLLVTITQLGYAAGLIFLVPIGDLLENRALITSLLWAAVVALLAAAASTSFITFAAASLAVGICSVVVQVLLPLAASLSPEATRGRVVGQVMSGLLSGILLARAVSGIVAGALGWRAVYLLSAGLLAVLNLVLGRVLPRRQPTFSGGYRELLASLARIFRNEPLLRRRAAYQAAMFGSFSAFWTSTTFLLAAPPFHLSQTEVGLFALSGALGALIAPLAGRWGDAGRGQPATGGALLLAAVSFALMAAPRHLWLLVLGAIFLDVAVQTTLVLGQQAIYGLNPAQRNRLNTLYISTFFLGGAAGSALSALFYSRRGWSAVVGLGVGMPLAAFLLWLTEKRPAWHRKPKTGGA